MSKVLAFEGDYRRTLEEEERFIQSQLERAQKKSQNWNARVEMLQESLRRLREELRKLDA